MTTGTFKLVSGTLTLDIPKGRFVGRTFPRDRIDGPSIEYSLSGTPVNSGVFYESKHLWEAELLLKPDEEAVLLRQYDYWLLTKPRPLLLLHDYTEAVHEPVQSRALADGASITVLTSPSGWAEYFAQFSVFFLAKPKRVKEGFYRQVTLRLQELDKVAPP